MENNRDFFSPEELQKLREKNENLVSYNTFNNEPFLNYNEAISVFNDVTKGNFDLKLISGEKDLEEDIYTVICSLVIRKNEMTREIQGFGIAPIIRESDDAMRKRLVALKYSEEQIKAEMKKDIPRKITNPGDYKKAAITDFLKKTFMSLLEIGLVQIGEAKDKQKEEKDSKKKGKSFNGNNPQASNNKNPNGSQEKSSQESGKIICSSCGKEATEKAKNFSMQKYGKILCYNCQPK